TIASFAIEEAKELTRAADVMAAMSLDAIRGTVVAFDPGIQAARQQPGQAVVAQNLRALFTEDDAIMESHKDCGKVQDPYSFRCVPQVHGASRDVVRFVAETVERELNSV